MKLRFSLAFGAALVASSLRLPSWAGTALAIGLVAGLIAFLATRTEKGPGPAALPRAGGLSAVRLSSGAASDYDPEGDGEESPDATQFAIDGNNTTSWDTEIYRDGLAGVNKDGVGLYVNAGSPVSARRLDLVTATPGYEAIVYAANTVPGDITDWTKVSPRTKTKETTKIPLDTARRKFRYYLVWIVSLPPGNRADIRELGLRR
jgi:hypothetical protein